MPLPETQATPKPFKTMDIKAAFLAAGNRKRKVSPSVSVSQSKVIKLNEEEKTTPIEDKMDDDIEILVDTKDTSISEFKENKDLNSIETVTVNQCNGKPNHAESPKLEISGNSHHSDEEDSPKESSCEMDSFNDCKLLNTSGVSILDTSGVSVLNTSEISENLEVVSKSESDAKGPDKVSDGKENEKDEKLIKKRLSKKKMTPEEAKKRADEREIKQKELLQKKQEVEAEKLRKKQEKEREIKERQLRKELEKKEKEEDRKEKEKKKQEKKDQEEQEKLLKSKEKDEKVKQKQILLEQKLEEKKKKEEMKIKKDEETKKLEEEKQKSKLEKEHKEKEKQERAKAAFFKFFKKEGSSPAPVAQSVEKEGAFKPFQVSDDMILAPVVPAAAQERFNRRQLDNLVGSQDVKELYLQILKAGGYKDVRLRKRQRRPRLSEADVVPITDKYEPVELCMSAKLLQFSENVRPPYWGTWRKKSIKISPRNPFGEDENLDYSVDSDDEWDEGGPGESLSGTEDEAESEDDYEVDNEFFVPHGYLSAEEEKEDEDEVDNDPEKQKALLKLKLQEFEKERRKKTTELKPIILGCFFENVGGIRDSGLHAMLQPYCAIILTEAPIPTLFTVQKAAADAKPQPNANSPPTGSSAKKKFVQFSEEAMPHFIRLIHGNTNKRLKLIREFQLYWQQHTRTTSIPSSDATHPEKPPPTPMDTNDPPTEPSPAFETPNPDSSIISKRQLDIILRKISTYGKSLNPLVKKSCWWVNDDMLEKYGLKDIPIPNAWSYVSTLTEGETPPVKSTPPVKPIPPTSIKEFLCP